MLSWARTYRSEYLSGDVIAGIIVATMLVPQAMAYAMLAGMPPQTGLYASIVPVVIYAMFGSSNYLAIGPVAIVSLMVASITGELAQPGSDEYLNIAIVLATLSGLAMIVFALLRFGALVNFLSHSVITGLINAASLIIIASQLKYLLGLDIPRASFFKTLNLIASSLDQTNVTTTIISIVAVSILLFSRKPLEKLMLAKGFSTTVTSIVTRTGALVVVLLCSFIVWVGTLHETAGIEIVGTIPAGLPPFLIPSFDAGIWYDLLPAAILIAFVSYLESISIARSLASKRRQRIKPNRELFALGAANISAAFSAAFPVAGGFGRSGVNFSAGANTPLASIITAILILLTLLILSPLFYYLPKAVLAAIVFMAVLNLIDIASVKKAWHFNKADALSSVFTFIAVLIFGVEKGVLIGITISLAHYLWRTSKPHMAVVGRVGDTEHFRNIKRHKVRTWPHIIAIRIDESLYFANAHALEDKLLELISTNEEVKHVVLICSAINFIDVSALETLEGLLEKLHNAGVLLHLAEVKGPVMDKLKKSDLLDQLGEGNVYLSTHEAMHDLEDKDTYYQI